MDAIYIILLSVGAALICSMLRVQRPEIAFIVSLSVGLGTLLLCSDSLRLIADSTEQFIQSASIDSESAKALLKAAGLTILCELGVQVCSDAGESALAGRIRLACRIAMLGMAMPFISKIMDVVSAF